MHVSLRWHGRILGVTRSTCLCENSAFGFIANGDHFANDRQRHFFRRGCANGKAGGTVDSTRVSQTAVGKPGATIFLQRGGTNRPDIADTRGQRRLQHPANGFGVVPQHHEAIDRRQCWGDTNCVLDPTRPFHVPADEPGPTAERLSHRAATKHDHRRRWTPVASKRHAVEIEAGRRRYVADREPDETTVVHAGLETDRSAFEQGLPDRGRQRACGAEDNADLCSWLGTNRGSLDGVEFDRHDTSLGRFSRCELEQSAVERTAEQRTKATTARGDRCGVGRVKRWCALWVEKPGNIDTGSAAKACGHTQCNPVHVATVVFANVIGMLDRSPPEVAALVLAAGSSRRLGQPKQLLPFRGATLLDATISTVCDFGLSQTLVTIGGAAPEVQDTVDLSAVQIVESLHHTDGCSSSIVSALDAIDPTVSGFMLFLGDQPDVSQAAVDALLEVAATGVEIAVVDYNDGIGHPFWFARSVFGPLTDLHGDKAVWKLLESGRFDTAHVRVDAPVPLDVDTWDDYEALLARG